MTEIEILQQIAADIKAMRESIQLMAGKQQEHAVQEEIAGVMASGIDPVKYLQNKYKNERTKKTGRRANF